jgi:DNA polymerase III gamma/tau subunit
VLGQPKVVKTLQAFARNPYSTALLFEGETGTGKTSTAVALASALGCAVDQAEFGGLSMIASGEQTATASAGDAVHYRADQPHSIRNIGRGRAEAYMIVHYRSESGG